MTYNNVINCQQLLIDLIEYLFSIKGDGIFKEWVDLDKRKTFGNVMIDDIGDTSPFAYYVYDNYSTNNKDNKDQIDLYTKNVISKYQQQNGLFITNKDLDKKNNYIKTYNADKMSDISLGLNLMFKLTNDQFYLDSAIKFFDGLEKLNIINHSIAYMKFGIIKIPFFSGKWDGLYIEEKVNLYNLTNDYKYIDSALINANYWINSKFFETYGLFSFESILYVKPFIRPVFKLALGIPFDSAMSSKANANLIFGLTELYLVTKKTKLKEALKKWVVSTEKLFMHPEGYFYSFWSKKDGQQYVFLGNDHAMVDALIGIYKATGFKKALTIAIKNVDYWLLQQTKEGYFRQGVEGEEVTFAKWVKGKDSQMTRLDTLTDYGVMLLKIYELTGNKKYFIACERMINGLLKYSSFGKAYVDVIDTTTLKKKDFKIETKFLFLLTKLFLSFDLLNNNGSIYKNSVFKSLIRDR